jgi:ubiquinone/menaquinone biosynthesis C-methylase UbiE
MGKQLKAEVEIQRRYYAETAAKYDAMHVNEGDEHYFALCLMVAAVDFLGVKSVLDVGSGTGRVIAWLKHARPELVVRGIEPVEELRKVGHANGIGKDVLVDGDALALGYRDGEFDLVCEFGVLHHIKQPERAVAEMLRVSRRAVFISDSNNFGHGGTLARALKQLFDAVGLWPVVDFVKTRGRGYTISEGDGLAYSYSVFNNYAQIKSRCSSVHVINTAAGGVNPYRTASHVALLGIKGPTRA